MARQQRRHVAAVAGAGLMLAVAGCAASGAAFRPVDAIPEQKALVYIYRPNSLIGGAISYDVHAGNQTIVQLKRGGYYPYLADPGETEFWARTEARSSVTQMLQAGRTYYLKGGVGIGLVAGRPKLNFVDENRGMNEVAKCKLLTRSE